ncbi:Uncharacterised protein [uncultured archaeon]|nr:Uncharacterised protein [uncultured archaeon]
MSNCDSPGFFGTVIASMIGCSLVIGGCNKINDLDSKLERMIKKVPVVLEEKSENLFGNPNPEKYFMINGQKAYTQVNGKPIESYFAEKQEQNSNHL